MKMKKITMACFSVCSLLTATISGAACWQHFDAATSKQEWRNNGKMRIGQIQLINNSNRTIEVELYHPDDPSGKVFANWTISPGSTYLAMNNQQINIGSDWGIRVNSGCIDMIGNATMFSNGAHRVAFSGNSGNSNGPNGDGLGGADYMSPEPGELVTAGGHEGVEGGYGEANVRLDRSGNLYADLKAKSESNIDGVHAAGFVIGLDRRGRMLFVSDRFEIPTACAKLDPTCRLSTATGVFQQHINPAIARYVAKLEVKIISRNNGSFWERARNGINQSVGAWNDLPPEVQKAIITAAKAAAA